MKYNDISTKRWNEKQLNKDESRTSRSIRRENDRSLVAFGIKVKRYIESEWWDSFKHENKMLIYESWLSHNYSQWRNTSFDLPKEELNFKSWIILKYNSVKPEKPTYRDNKLNKLFGKN